MVPQGKLLSSKYNIKFVNINLNTHNISFYKHILLIDKI